MKNVSIFTDYLQELYRISAKIDRATAADAELVQIQQIQARIENGYTRGYFSLEKRQALRRTAEILLDECREVIRLNAAVKEIEKEIRAERRKEARRRSA